MTVDITNVYNVYTVTRPEPGEVYPITFPFIAPEYVKCYYAVDKEQTNLVYGRDYTVSEAGELTVVGSVPVDAKLVIYRVTDLTQEIDWVDGQAVYTPDIEQADDKAMHILQELAEQTNRSVKITREEEAAGTNPEYRWEEIEQARNEVLAAKDATESAKIDAETAKDEAELARDETLDARDTALEVIGNAKEEAREVIYEDKEAALAEIVTAKDTALTDMADRKDDHIVSINSAKSEALEAINTDKQGALDTIDSYTNMAISSVGASGAEWVQKAKDEAVRAEAAREGTEQARTDVLSAKDESLVAISGAETSALGNINTSKDEAVSEVTTAVSDQVNRATQEADRAKSEADRAQRIVDIGPATADKLGLVKVGQGLSVATDGTISADIPDVDVATKDKAGIVQIGNGLTVDATGKIDVDFPEPPAPYTLPIATADVLGGVKVGNGLSITPTGVLSADAQPVDIATADKAGIVKPNTDMEIDDDGTLTDKREMLYFEEEPEEGLPTEGVKEGAIAFIDDGEGGLPAGGSGTTFIPSVSEAGVLSWTNNGGLPNPTPVNIMGANGVAGFLPDYTRRIPLTFELVTQTYNTYYSQPLPEDGWVYVVFTGSGTASWFNCGMSHNKIDGDAGIGQIIFQSLYVVGNNRLCFPCKKGDYAFIRLDKSKTFTNVNFIFLPILKPNLSEEHVVGYINNKPVYEIAEQQPDGTVTMRHYTKTTD